MPEENTKKYTITFRINKTTEAHIIEKLESTKNISAYIRELILNDIQKKQGYNNRLNNLEERLNNLEKRIKTLEFNSDDNYF